MRRAWFAMRDWVWWLLILTMPITSMPVVINLVGSDTVGSPAVLLLGILVLGWLLPAWLLGKKQPKLVIPLLVFVLAALLSSVAAWFIEIPPYKDISVLRTELVALITLLIGVGFYLLTIQISVEKGKIEASLRWLNYAGILVIAWCLVQALAWRGFGGYPQWMRDFHDLYSRGPLYNNRVTGFALEPSWLANQFNLLFLPFWFAASVKRWSAFKIKLFRYFLIEDALLAGGLLALFLSLSRVGLLATLLMVAFLLLRLNTWLIRFLERQLQDRNFLAHISSARRQRILNVFISVGLAILYLGGLVGVGVIFSRTDPRMKELFTFSFGDRNPLLEYADALNFSTRVVYWQAGWETFNDYPFLGVGLGNAGFFFPEKLDAFAWELVEVRDLVYRSGNLLNSKCLWVRILAETGVIGFALFAVWLLLMWKASDSLEKSVQPVYQMSGLMGKLLIIALIMEGFSVDSFALPYFWFSLGLITAAAWLNQIQYRRTSTDNKQEVH